MVGHDGTDGVEDMAAGQVKGWRDLDACGRFLVPLFAHEAGAY